MLPLLTYFDPQPGRDALPPRLASPFAGGPPHPLAQQAALQLQDNLRRHEFFPPDAFEGIHRGTMFGVLVVSDQQGRIGYLKGFAGMVQQSWRNPGFVGPLFDEAARDAVWPFGQARLNAFAEQIAAIDTGEPTLALRANLAKLDLAHAEARAALTPTHETQRKTERRMRTLHRAERAGLLGALAALAADRAELRRQQAALSCGLLEQFFQGYLLVNARHETRLLRDIFAPGTPPGGAADCAAPKLFGHAQRHGLQPLALAEFWWGTPPRAGGRQEGRFYPACRGKCGPVLGHMLAGWDVEPPPLFGDGVIPPDEPRTVFEDAWIVVVEKPVGLLSIPGRSGGLQDCVRSRLRRRYPAARGEIVVHRLDLDTSGLLLGAKDPQTHAALQKQFALRTIEKRYIAWLDGVVNGEQGTIDLPIRVDLDDRPRQIHDPVHGKPALTRWRVLRREGARTRVALFPHTGRTHQLRVHAAHPQGLNAPIVGDRLYGPAGDRLMLHAEALSFIHPHTGQPMQLEAPAPF